jgi:hypothetical protein
MSKPERIQLRRTKGWRMPSDAVKVDRSAIFGNPFSLEQYGPEQAVALHRLWIEGCLADDDIRPGYPTWAARFLIERRQKVLEALPKLRGKNLACWCALPLPGERDCCHAAVLLEIANR